jgi:hypothetical protein
VYLRDPHASKTMALDVLRAKVDQEAGTAKTFEDVTGISLARLAGLMALWDHDTGCASRQDGSHGTTSWLPLIEALR